MTVNVQPAHGEGTSPARSGADVYAASRGVSVATMRAWPNGRHSRWRGSRRANIDRHERGRREVPPAHRGEAA